MESLNQKNQKLIFLKTRNDRGESFFVFDDWSKMLKKIFFLENLEFNENDDSNYSDEVCEVIDALSEGFCWTSNRTKTKYEYSVK